MTGRPLTWGGTDFPHCRTASVERGLNGAGYSPKLERGDIAGLRFVRSLVAGLRDFDRSCGGRVPHSGRPLRIGQSPATPPSPRHDARDPTVANGKRSSP